MLEIAICEDEQADRERLREMLHTILDKYSLEQQITCYSSGEELLNASLRFDLIFMDIVMEGRNGIDIGQEIYGKNQSVKIIYQTNFNEYCMDAVNTVHAFAFLEKPSVLLSVDVIQYFEYIKSRKKVKLVTENAAYEYPDIMSNVEARMQPYGFETSCRGILVNLRNVMKIRGYDVILKNGEPVPLSQKRVTDFKKRLNECVHSEE